MKKTFKLLVVLALGTLALSSCKKNKSDDPTPETPVDPGGGDEENITRVQLFFTDSANTATTFSVKYNDPDGDGRGNPPIIDSLKLEAGKVYVVKLGIFDDTKTPVDTVSKEIEEEANYHRFHYVFAPASGSIATIASTILDVDTKTPPQPLGLSFKLKTGTGKGKGTFTVNLRHFDNGQEKTGDPAGGEQDVLVDFPVRVY